MNPIEFSSQSCSNIQNMLEKEFYDITSHDVIMKSPSLNGPQANLVINLLQGNEKRKGSSKK